MRRRTMSAANGSPLILAVPSKGRLQQNAESFFARAGATFVGADNVMTGGVTSLTCTTKVWNPARRRCRWRRP